MTTCGVIGIGKMGEALFSGLSSLAAEEEIRLTGYEISPVRKREIEEKYGLLLAGSLGEMLEQCQVLILAVKPQQMEELLEEIGKDTGGKLIVSIAAGVSTKFIEEKVAPSTRVVRVMPNAPALIREGTLAYCLGPNASFDDGETVKSLLASLGMVVEVPEELMDAVTALSGSGPAYVFLFTQALIDAGVRVGLSRDLASDLVLQTMKGSVELVRRMKGSPAAMIEWVTSPGGTTIAALHSMERAGIKGIIMDGVKAAWERSRELEKLDHSA